jgi:hypothetical protein
MAAVNDGKSEAVGAGLWAQRKFDARSAQEFAAAWPSQQSRNRFRIYRYAIFSASRYEQDSRCQCGELHIAKRDFK